MLSYSWLYDCHDDDHDGDNDDEEDGDDDDDAADDDLRLSPQRGVCDACLRAVISSPVSAQRCRLPEPENAVGQFTLPVRAHQPVSLRSANKHVKVKVHEWTTQ